MQLVDANSSWIYCCASLAGRAQRCFVLASTDTLARTTCKTECQLAPGAKLAVRNWRSSLTRRRLVSSFHLSSSAQGFTRYGDEIVAQALFAGPTVLRTVGTIADASIAAHHRVHTMLGAAIAPIRIVSVRRGESTRNHGGDQCLWWLGSRRA
jgi:hypothetical protein